MFLVCTLLNKIDKLTSSIIKIVRVTQKNKMTTIAYLGPVGTNSETVALSYRKSILNDLTVELKPYPSIAKVMEALAKGQVNWAVVPVENSTAGGVAITLDGLWEFDTLHIHKELVLPICHLLLSSGTSLEDIKTVYSHPQALAQCQKWLEVNLPNAEIIPTNSTTEALEHIKGEANVAAIASPRAAETYDLPILASEISDYSDNCTRFWVLSRQVSRIGRRISLAFSVSQNVPGALVRPLQALANRQLNLSRIESRPTKRSLGEYIFFLDLEVTQSEDQTQMALEELSQYVEILKIFGRYEVSLI